MATRKEKDVLHADLRKWVNVLGYRITDTELKVITNNSRNTELWRLLQKLILPGDDIKNIRSKLASYQQKQDYSKVKQDVDSLQKKKQELLAKIAASKTRSNQMVTSIKTLKSKVMTDSHSKSENINKLFEHTMKEVLQKAITTHCSKIQTSFKESSNTLQSATTQAIQLGLSEGSSTLIMSGARNSIETECTRSIQNMLGEIKLYLENHISQSTQDSAARAKLWENVSKIQKNYAPEEILSSINTITSDQCSSLKSLSASFNVENELKDLMFDFVGGNLVNKEDIVNPEKALEIKAEELQNRDSKEWIQMLDCKNKSAELKKTITIFQNELENNLQVLPGETRSALGAVLKFELRHKELLAKEEAVKGELKRLRNAKETATAAKIKTLSTQKSIRDFKENSSNKQMVIKTLVSQTKSLESALNNQISEISDFVSTKLLPLTEVFASELTKVKSYPETLTNTLYKIPLDRLYLSPISSGSCPVADLSIYQFQTSGNYHKLLANCNLPQHLDSNTFLAKLTEILTEPMSDRMILSVFNNICTVSDKEVPNSNDVFEALREALFEFDTFTSENVVDRLNKHSDNCSSSMRKCNSLKEKIKLFNDQPAQHLVPWVTVEGKTLKEVQEEWNVKWFHG